MGSGSVHSRSVSIANRRRHTGWFILPARCLVRIRIVPVLIGMMLVTACPHLAGDCTRALLKLLVFREFGFDLCRNVMDVDRLPVCNRSTHGRVAINDAAL